MNRINWTGVAVFAGVALLVFLIAASLLGGRGYGGWGMMGPGMMDGGWGYSPFGWIGMIFMGLIPVGFLVLTVLGIVWLVRSIGSGTNPPTPAKTCPSCGRGVQADWRNCPYCGTALTPQ
jgi:zinc ribbon protein